MLQEHSNYWLFISSTALQDGNTGLINAETITVTEGGNIIHACSFSFSGSRKIFCKEGCEEKDILVETTGDRAQRGRYSIEWKEADHLLAYSVLYVSITNLTKSDSGRYTCRLDRDLFLDSKEEFEIRVEDGEFLLRVFGSTVHCQLLLIQINQHVYSIFSLFIAAHFLIKSLSSSSQTLTAVKYCCSRNIHLQYLAVWL